MVVIKTEPEVDPLDIQTSDATSIEVKRSLSEEDWHDLQTVKEELKLEITIEENEVLTESTLNTKGNETTQIKWASSEECLSSENPVRESSPEPQNYDQIHGQKNCQIDEGSNKCHICGKLLRTLQRLKMHLRTHTAERKFECNSCGKHFFRLEHLKSHVRTHIGDKPFNCDVCGKSFSQWGSLKVHSRTHSGDKPFKCNVCGKRFVQSCAVTVHGRMHSGEKPFKCNVCGICFLQSGHLTLHLRTHSGEKPFKCDICGKHFVRLDRVKEHLRTHSGERPFKCDVCGKFFCFVWSSHRVCTYAFGREAI
ncbi:zinc finger protein 664-like isoform X1 [Periplaneta americana]|uniref:zinc finger protein 664-like isoform X1 n=1 Tax=Periplaneta americana TaxID=6978 RepID=UPI0037E967C8